MKNLIVTGFMGTGKTTVGRLLARRYGMEFVDTDQLVEQRAGCSISALFARDGEAAFRQMESDVFRSALEGTDTVIATGGGTLMDPRHQSLVDLDQTVVCLTCAPHVIQERLGDAPERPLFHPRQPGTVQSLLAERESVYSRYSKIDTTEIAPDDVVRSIADVASLAQTASITSSEQQSSTVLFEEGLAERLGDVMAAEGLVGQALVLTDSRVAKLDIFTEVQASLRIAGFAVSTHIIAEGEEHKTLRTLETCYAAAMQAGLDRSGVVVGVGGGVVGDMAGMLAATYLRGLHLVLVPTTLLAQVDAAIGGKVGVDFHGAKNMIGAFKPARYVMIDPRVLQTLPSVVLTDGLVEIVKIGFVRSRRLVSLLAAIDPDRILDYPHLIRLAARAKVEVVQRDPREHGERMLLNFGHTVGHGLEAASGYRLSHGQAVSIGMVTETRLAVSRGWCDNSTLRALTTLLGKFTLPMEWEDLDLERIVHFVAQDKKRRAGQIRLAVPQNIGEGAVVEVPLDDVRAALEESIKV